jgi:hypothetical protein
MSWARSTNEEEEEKGIHGLVRKPERKRSLRKPRRSSKNNIKTDLKQQDVK